MLPLLRNFPVIWLNESSGFSSNNPGHAPRQDPQLTQVTRSIVTFMNITADHADSGTRGTSEYQRPYEKRGSEQAKECLQKKAADRNKDPEDPTERYRPPAGIPDGSKRTAHPHGSHGYSDAEECKEPYGVVPCRGDEPGRLDEDGDKEEDQKEGDEPVPCRALPLIFGQPAVLEPGLEEGQRDDGKCPGQFHHNGVGSSNDPIDRGGRDNRGGVVDCGAGPEPEGRLREAEQVAEHGEEDRCQDIVDNDDRDRDRNGRAGRPDDGAHGGNCRGPADGRAVRDKDPGVTLDSEGPADNDTGSNADDERPDHDRQAGKTDCCNLPEGHAGAEQNNRCLEDCLLCKRLSACPFLPLAKDLANSKADEDGGNRPAEDGDEYADLPGNAGDDEHREETVRYAESSRNAGRE